MQQSESGVRHNYNQVWPIIYAVVCVTNIMCQYMFSRYLRHRPRCIFLHYISIPSFLESQLVTTSIFPVTEPLLAAFTPDVVDSYV